MWDVYLTHSQTDYMNLVLVQPNHVTLLKLFIVELTNANSIGSPHVETMGKKMCHIDRSFPLEKVSSHGLQIAISPHLPTPSLDTASQSVYLSLRTPSYMSVSLSQASPQGLLGSLPSSISAYYVSDLKKYSLFLI